MALYFAADRTLGKLVKWLRILGFDTTFEIDVPAELFYEHLEKDRIVLTRTGKIKKHFSPTGWFSSHQTIWMCNSDRSLLKSASVNRTPGRLQDAFIVTSGLSMPIQMMFAA